jgi:chromate transporter
MATWREVFKIFLQLGMTSFGGPAAHIGYFRQAFVEQRQWLNESQFAQLLAICQFLPGPASSQLGFAIGLHRAGWQGALAAFVAFTTPSVILLIAFAALLPLLGPLHSEILLHGLKLVPVAVVLHAVVAMAQSLLVDIARRFIALLAVLIMVWVDSSWGQILAIVMGAGLGLVLLFRLPVKQASAIYVSIQERAAQILLIGFAGCLVLALIWVSSTGVEQFLASYYRAGALVFGGAHVVLPLLDQAVVTTGLVSETDFMAGYGAAQAVPGPMFTLAAFLGYIQGGLGYALLGVIAIFLPGFLLLAGILPFWHKITKLAWSGRLVAGVNAAVVGLLVATLYDPIATSALLGPIDWLVAIVAFALLQWARINPLWIVCFCVLATSIFGYIF